MVTSPMAAEVSNISSQDHWSAPQDSNGAGGPELGGGAGDSHIPQQGDYSNGGDASLAGDGPDAGGRSEKQLKLNKVYIGGLPEHTRREDLQSCFGKIGNIINIELKVGYGFVEFESREAAEESVAKYHEGYFMGNKIRVEISHGGGRTAKYNNDPGACFKCGEQGHWARECPNYHRRSVEPPLVDRIRDYPPPPRDYGPPREEFGRYPPPPPGRDPRFSGSYEYPPGRDYRRPPSPSREYRDYPPTSRPPPRDYDDYRRGPPGPPPSAARYDSRPPPGGYYPAESPSAPPGGYPRGYPPPLPRDAYDRYDRRGPPPPPANDRYASYPPPGVRQRTPPGVPPPRARDEFERVPPRDYGGPPDIRGRPPSPPPPSRYSDYAPRGDMGPRPGYRRRSQSPPPRSVPNTTSYDAAPYPPASDRFAGNGYSVGGPGGPGGPPRGAPPRDYIPPRGGRDDAYRRP